MASKAQRNADVKRARDRAVSPHLRLGNNRTSAETKKGVMPIPKAKGKR